MQKRKLSTRIMLAFIALALFLCACQPTPDAPIVNAGDDTELNDKINATPIPTPEPPENTDEPIETLSTIYGFPTEQKDEFECLDTNVSVTVDAEVIVPEVQAVPVVEVEPTIISPKTVKNFVEAMHPGVIFYDNADIITKSEIMKRLEDYQEKAAIPWEEFPEYYYNATGINDEDSAREYYEQCQAMVEAYKELLKTAPETKQQNPTDFEYHNFFGHYSIVIPEILWSAEYHGDSTDRYYEEAPTMYMTATIDNAFIAEVFVSSRPGEEIKSSLEYRLGTDRVGGNGNAYWEPARVGEMTIGESEAVILGNEAIKKLGLENEMVLSKINAIDYYGKVISDGKGKVLTYTLQYHRGFNGLVAGNVYIENDYAYVVGNEEVIITIQSDRVVKLEYNNPYEATNVENENVGLIPFEQAYEAFKKQARIEFTLRNICSTPSDVDQGLVDHCDVTIAEIQFLMVRIPIKNGGYRYVPAWQFRGRDAEYYKDGDVDTGFGYSNIYMTINAVDGTIID